MKLNSLRDAIADYERITGETVQNYDYTEYINGVFFNPSENKYMLILPSNEWCIYAIGEREGVPFLHIDQVYGFMKNIAPYLMTVTKACKIEKIVTTTQRNPRYHMRKWKMKRLDGYDYDFEGRHYYALIGDIDGLTESMKW